MRMLVALMLALTGCTLVVGTEPRYVADGGVTDDGGADSNSCKSDCQSAYGSCLQKCPGGPGQKPCNDNCKSTLQNCDDACGP